MKSNVNAKMAPGIGFHISEMSSDVTYRIEDKNIGGGFDLHTSSHHLSRNFCDGTTVRTEAAMSTPLCFQFDFTEHCKFVSSSLQ